MCRGTPRRHGTPGGHTQTYTTKMYCCRGTRYLSMTGDGGGGSVAVCLVGYSKTGSLAGKECYLCLPSERDLSDMTEHKEMTDRLSVYREGRLLIFLCREREGRAICVYILRGGLAIYR